MTPIRLGAREGSGQSNQSTTRYSTPSQQHLWNKMNRRINSLTQLTPRPSQPILQPASGRLWTSSWLHLGGNLLCQSEEKEPGALIFCRVLPFLPHNHGHEEERSVSLHWWPLSTIHRACGFLPDVPVVQAGQMSNPPSLQEIIFF